MKMLKRAMLAVPVVLAAPLPALAQHPAQVVCRQAPGMLPGPLVPNEATARAIFLVVENGRGGPGDPRRFPTVYVTDEGARWSVSRGQAKSTPRAERVDGGGELQITIDKCTGQMGASFQR